MGRRKHLFYRKEQKGVKKKPTTEKEVESSTSTGLRITSRTHAKVDLSVTSNPIIASTITNYHRELKDSRTVERNSLRRKIEFVCGLSACLNWLMTICAYVVIHHDKDGPDDFDIVRTSVKVAVFGVSFLQVFFVTYYWHLNLKYTELLRIALGGGNCRTPRLRKSPEAMIKCGLECLFQLVAPIPGVSHQWTLRIFGAVSEVGVDDFLYLAVVFKNYHSLRLLFWSSHFSNMRTQLLTSIAGVKFNGGFLFRCYLSRYHLSLILLIFGLMVVLSGLVEYILEHQGPSTSYFSDQENVFWIVAYTQVSIGYGEGHLGTFLGQVMMLLSCFLGLFTLGLLNSISSGTLVLNLTECNLYSELLYTKHKRIYQKQAALLIRSWWRLMHMRMNKKMDVYIVLSFYSQLRVYRRTLVACQHVKDTRFERQIEAFWWSTHSRIRPLNEYLNPIQDAYSTLQDVLRNQYRISTVCDNAFKNTRRHRGIEVIERSPTTAHSRDDASDTASKCSKTQRSAKNHRPASVRSGQGRAKAKLHAYQNVISRLIKEEALPSPDLLK